MKKLLIFAIIIATAFTLNSCFKVNRDKEKSIGGASEILFVTQNEAQWEGPIGQAIRDCFEVNMVGFSQPEKKFKIIHINSKEFTGFYEKYRHIIMCEIVKDLPKPTIDIKHDWKTAPQYIVTIKATTPETWVKVFDSEKADIEKAFDNTDYKRIQQYFHQRANADVIEGLKNTFGFSMTIPNGYYIAVNKDNFMWIRNEDKEKSFGLIIYELPYTSTYELSAERIIVKTDSVTQKYIPATMPNSYMELEKNYFPPVFKVIPDFPAGYAVEMRALWQTVNDFMGGPCVSYTIVNPDASKLICVEGFIYYPNKPKRDLLRQLEAIIWSLQF